MATIYSGAQILGKIALLHSHLTTSPKAVELTLQTESTAQQERVNTLDSLAAIFNYTTVFDVTFGHKDSFKHPKYPPIFEKQVWFPLGEPDPSLNLDGYLKKEEYHQVL
jgi:hypothetical protein